MCGWVIASATLYVVLGMLLFGYYRYAVRAFDHVVGSPHGSINGLSADEVDTLRRAAAEVADTILLDTV